MKKLVLSVFIGFLMSTSSLFAHEPLTKAKKSIEERVAVIVNNVDCVLAIFKEMKIQGKTHTELEAEGSMALLNIKAEEKCGISVEDVMSQLTTELATALFIKEE